MARRATDILIVTTESGSGTIEDWREHPPAGDPPVDLGRDLRIEQLSLEKAESLMDGCMPRSWEPVPTRQYGQRYALVRRDAPDPDCPIFDPDETILAAVTLSRYVVPNRAGFEYAARVIDDESGQRVVSLDPAAQFSAYVAEPQRRGWLDAGETADLRALLDCFWRDRSHLPERVSHAIWFCEQTSRESYLEVAWPQIVTTLEALIHTDRHLSRRQFVSRVEALAREFCIPGVNADFLSEAYEIRSAGLHGSRVPFHAQPTAAEEFGRLQAIVHETLRRAIEDVTFR